MRILLFLFVITMHAQPVLTPSPDRSGAAAGESWGNYSVTNSAETGYRFTQVGGDANLFKSVQYYGNGMRLFGNNFTANSKEGHGRYFDSMSLTTTGLGNDPYGMATMRVEKNRRYRYDITWRRNDYFNNSLLNGESATQKNTRRTMQDHELSINGPKWVRFVAGYNRNHETGPELTAYETYIGGLARSVLPLNRDTRREFNSYRAGAELTFAGFRLSLTRRWDFYKDDSAIESLIAGQPYSLDYLRNQPFDPSLEVTYRQAATSYLRSQPMHSRNDGYFGNLFRKSKYWSMNARMTYNKGASTTVYYENQTGLAQASGLVATGDGRVLTGSNSGYGVVINAYTYMPGTARHPFLAGDAIFNLFPTRKLTVSNSLSVQSNRFDGTGTENRVLSNSAAVINRNWLFQVKTRRWSEALDVNYEVNKWLGLRSEYRYTARAIDNNLIRTGTTNGRDLNLVRNHLNAGTFGVRLRPVQALTVNGDVTVGRDNGPETPVSAARFHNVRGRVDYRAGRFQVGGTYRQQYNLNAPLSVFSASTGQLIVGAQLDYYASHQRDISGHASVDVNKHFSLDAAFTRAHIDTMANLWAELTPANSTTITTVSVRGYLSQYISNLQTLSFNARTTFGRGTLYTGYNLSRDTGDGRAQQNLGMANAAAFTASASTFPLTYHTPLVRLSMRINPKLNWNGGWEFYRYSQRFAYFGYQPYYRAHTGYTSLAFTF